MPKSPKQKNQAKAPQNPSPQSPQNQKPKAKSKSPSFSFSDPFINSGKQGGAEALREGRAGVGRDIVTGQTFFPASLNTSLGACSALFYFWLGLCLSQPTGKSN
jgi:hypothetical protein